ncbi:hypothetical protein F4814DRAFT_453324 [Daldinia grandis]|nr:hypothetical protein F4814DRAFT_453324 [Daldinia grandis]
MGLRNEVVAISKKSDTVTQYQQTQGYRNILDWLTHVGYGLRKGDNLECRQPGTGEWFLDTEQFQTWLASLQSACKGQGDVWIAYIYCEFGRQYKQTASQLLANILKQLAIESPPKFSESLILLFHKYRDNWFPRAEVKLADACLIYLLFNVFGSGSCQIEEDFEERIISNPFYNYSALHWAYHAQRASHIGQVAIEFLESNAKLESAYQAMVVSMDPLWGRISFNQVSPTQITGLHLVAWLFTTEMKA